jgi:hypothetical protein
MNQALYAHMNNKRKKKKEKNVSVKSYNLSGKSLSVSNKKKHISNLCLNFSNLRYLSMTNEAYIHTPKKNCFRNVRSSSMNHPQTRKWVIKLCCILTMN